MNLKYVHINIIANDWKKLSKFYQNVFQCIPIPPERDLRGDWVNALTGLKDVHICGEHLLLPGYGGNGPTIEIFSYNQMLKNEKLINKTGFTHIAFLVDDVEGTVELLKKNGGTIVGEIVTQEYTNGKIGTFVYCKDIEGNIVEIQKWE